MRTSLALLLLSLSFAPAAGLADGAASKLLANGTGKTVIRKIVLGNDITVAVLSRSGTAVVADPWRMPPGVVPDAITVTYGPHLDKAYLEAARAAKALVVQTGSWKVKDFQITGVAAGHSKKPIDPSAPEVVIYVYEVDGLRIADLSCIVQPKLEPEQLKALGPIDVALITGEAEDQAFPSKAARDSGDLVKQLGARIVIPLSH